MVPIRRMSSQWLLVVCSVLFSLSFSASSHAGPAFDGIHTLEQPNGISFDARQHGDEWYNWVETKDGYGIFRNSETGTWEYFQPSADANTGSPFVNGVSGAIVGVDDPAALGIPKGLRPAKTAPLQPGGYDVLDGSPAPDGPSGPTGAPALGTKRVLVIGVDYADAPALYTPAQIQPLLFGATNSVADYYSKTSYGAVSILPAAESHGTVDDGFIGWLRLSGNHPNTGANSGTANAQIAKNAILAADPYIDYSEYDTNGDGVIDSTELSIIIIVAGYERSYSASYSPSVWGHKWTMSTVGYPVVDGKTIQAYAEFGERHGDHLATMGIMAHELGHLLFILPDLYDTDGGSEGLGNFDAMAGGSWGAAAGTYPGSSPTQLSAWSKEYLAWGTVTTLASASTVAFPKTDGNSASLFRVNTADANEYFLIENRQFTGYDAGLQTSAGSAGHGGLAIYHIDRLKTNLWPASNTVNAAETSKGVDVEEANEGSLGYSMLDEQTSRGTTQMFYYQGNGAGFTDTSVPNSRLKNGASTAVSVTSISAYGDTMTAVIVQGMGDITPSPFGFAALANIALNSLQTSEYVTIYGIDAAAPVSITGGEYEINGSGSWTSAAGTINLYDQVRVRQMSAPANRITTTAVLTIGGVSGTFSVTTGGDGFTMFSISTSVTGSGSISPVSALVSYGSTTTFTTTPDAGSYIRSASGCGGTLTGATYTTGAVLADCTVTVTFEKIPSAYSGLFFIPAANRADMVHDRKRGMVYITNGDRVLRYNMSIGAFETPWVLGCNLKGIDISPDDNMLAVGDMTTANEQVWVHVINLNDGTSGKIFMPQTAYEAGTYAVAFGADGNIYSSSDFAGSGWTPFRKIDPVTRTAQDLLTFSDHAMVSASADGKSIAFAEGNISDGRFGMYSVPTGSLIHQTGYDLGTSWFNYEIAANHNGTQYAIPTYGGTFIYDQNLIKIRTLGIYATEYADGVSYNPVTDVLYLSLATTSLVRAYDTTTFSILGDYDFGSNFQWNGNWNFVDGRLRISKDGTFLFASVAGGIECLNLTNAARSALTTITSSANGLTAGQPVTFTAKIIKTLASSANVPTGLVTFLDGETILGSAMLTGTTPSASVTTTQLTAGPHSITAVYAGDANFDESTSAVLIQNVKVLLTVNKTGLGSGSVTTNAGQLAWAGNTGTLGCDLNSSITLTATAAAGSTYLNWTGCDSINNNQCVVTMSGARSVAVAFIRLGAPIITGASPTNNAMPRWSWNTGGGGNGIYRYKLDNSEMSNGTVTTTNTSYSPGQALLEGSHTLFVQEQDTAGNWSTVGSFTIVIDLTPPTLNAAATYVDSTHVSITFSEAVSGATSTTNYTLDNGLMIASVSSLGNNSYRLTTSHQTLGTTYTVTANSSNIVDLAGNHLSSGNNAAIFTRSVASNNAPSTPTLRWPAMSIPVGLNPTLMVNASIDADGDPIFYYIFEIYSDSGLTSLVTSVTTTGTSWTVSLPLQDHMTYYWRVIASDGNKNSSWMSTADFSIDSSRVPSQTQLVMQSDAGDWVGQGMNYSYTLADATFTARRNVDNGVSLDVITPGYGHWWYLDFVSPNEGLLTAGTYTGATRYGFHSPGVPEMDIFGDGRGCNTLLGSFEVKEISYGANNVIQSFRVTFEQHCDGEIPALRGDLRFNATVAAPITWPLNVSVAGAGTVHTSPGTDLACTSSCGTSYNEGSVVTLSAEPASGLMFIGWSGDCSGMGTCQTTMNAAKNITATFGVPTSTVVSAGGYHSTTIRLDGTLWTWGENFFGELGDGTTVGKNSPVQVAAGSTFRTVAAGEGYTEAIRTDGTLWAWGFNTWGELGDSTHVNRLSPVQIATGSTFSSVATGYFHTVAIKTDGTLWAWGSNAAGQLGDGTTTQRSSPGQVAEAGTFIAVAAGEYHSVALKTNGTLWAWGDNSYGQLGDSSSSDKYSPVQIAPGSTFTSVATGYNHTVTIRTDGTLWAWGDNSYGQLGDGTTTQRNSPVQIAPGSTFTAVAANGYNTLAIKTGGTLWAWGRNNYGQLGNGTTAGSSSPVQIVPGSTFASVAAGGEHSIAIKTDGTLWAWGRNMEGQIGDPGSNVYELRPVQVRPGSLLVTLIAGTGGRISPSTIQSVYYNSTASFEVVPSAGYRIDTVTGCSGTLSGTTYTTGPITAACTVSATFAPIIRSLSVTVTGSGAIHTSPGTDLACTSNCETIYNHGTVVTLTSEPGPGQKLSAWGGACSGKAVKCTLTMDAAKNVTADFIISPATAVAITSDKPSPADLSTVGPVTFTALASGGTGTYEYKFRFLDAVTGAWALMQPYSTKNTWTWTPTKPGIHTIQVQARNAGNTDAYQTLKSLTFEITGSPPASSVTLTANKTSPADLTTVGVVTFTALASGGSGTYEYNFRYQDPVTGLWTVVQAYSTENTWNWTPTNPGIHTIEVQARNVGSTAAYETTKILTFEITASLPASSGTLTANKPSPGLLSSIGPVTFTATAGGGTGIYEYKFRIKDNAVGTWSIVQDYSSTNTWSWTPTQAGSYDIQVMVRNVGSQAAYEVMRKLTFNIVASSPVSAATLTADKTTPVVYGTVGAVTFTALASGGTGTYEYQFRSRTNPTGAWTIVQPYSPANTWSWSPAGPGAYDIQVMARNAGSGASYEALSPMLTFNVITATPVSSVALTADKTTPAIFGTLGSVTFTGVATGGTGPAEYKFRIKDEATGIWTIVQDFSSINTWAWTPGAAGTYTIEVRARNAGSTASYEALRTLSFNVVESTPVSSVTLTANKTSPALLGSVGTVTVTANAAGGSSSYEYTFLLKDDTGIWTTVQNYSGANTWSWTPNAAGAFVIKVMARNARSASTYEAFATVNFNIVTVTPVSGVTLTADKPSGSPAGSTITFTANATGGTGSYEYKFQVKDSSGIWTTMRDYSSDKAWVWTPGQAGTFVIKVMARSAGSPASYEQFRTMTFSVAN